MRMYFILNLAIMMCSEAINEWKRSNGSIVRVRVMQIFAWKDWATKPPFILCLHNILVSEKYLQTSLIFVENVISKIEQFHLLGTWEVNFLNKPATM
jgi:hypothetical protein